MASTLPYTSYDSKTLDELRNPLGENARVTNQALAERVVGHYVVIDRYAATGATTTKINLAYQGAPGSSPVAVLLIRAYETNDPGKDLSVATRLNFVREATTLRVFEPSGLSANTLYQLTFLVLETP